MPAPEQCPGHVRLLLGDWLYRGQFAICIQKAFCDPLWWWTQRIFQDKKSRPCCQWKGHWQFIVSNSKWVLKFKMSVRATCLLDEKGQCANENLLGSWKEILLNPPKRKKESKKCGRKIRTKTTEQARQQLQMSFSRTLQSLMLPMTPHFFLVRFSLNSFSILLTQISQCLKLYIIWLCQCHRD